MYVPDGGESIDHFRRLLNESGQLYELAKAKNHEIEELRYIIFSFTRMVLEIIKSKYTKNLFLVKVAGLMVETDYQKASEILEYRKEKV